jgi:ribosomal-protein-alanine N-acetyltransferase
MSSYKITTPQLGLRELDPSDAEQMFALNNAEVLRFTGDSPFLSVAAAYNFLENYPDYKMNGFGRLAVVVKESEEVVVGWCGLKRDMKTNEVDIGYRLFKAHWGKGYATEASKACMDFGINKLKLPRIIGTASKDNLASIRVFDKLGMKHEKEFDDDGEMWVLYALES